MPVSPKSVPCAIVDIHNRPETAANEQPYNPWLPANKSERSVVSIADRYSFAAGRKPTPSPTSGNGRREQLVALVPAAAIVLVLLLLGALLWFLDREEREATRITLINDALWVEQALRFAIQSDQDDLNQLAFDIRRGLPLDGVQTRFEHLIRNSPEITGIAWLNAEGTPAMAVPGGFAENQTHGGLAQSLALQSGKSTYSEAFKTTGSGYAFESVVPLFDGMKPAGLLVAQFSLDGLLANQIPWWVAQQYQVTFENSQGQVLARKSQSATVTGESRHAILFDPPSGGLLLAIESFDERTDLASNVLIAAIAWFSLIAVASLVATRSNMKRRSAAESALHEEHAFRKAMEESLTVGMRARDLDGTIIYVNPSFCKMTGFSESELIGRSPPMPYWLPDELDRTLELHRMVLDGMAPTEGFEIKFQRSNGDRFDALIYEAPLIDAQGRHCGWMASVVDITERKYMEDMARQQNEKLEQTARLVTMGEMASTIAHELNQPLAAISSYATGSLKRLESGEIATDELLSVFGKLSTQAQRAGQIIRRVREFVRKNEPKFALLDLDELIASTLDFVAPELKARGIVVEQETTIAIPACRGDRILLEQVLLNLVRNAIEAMAKTPKRNRVLSISRYLQGDELITAIADRGSGISPEIREKLFVPFVTTKREGMGMGLNICRTIIELHQGRLWVEDRPDGGTILLFSIAQGSE